MTFRERADESELMDDLSRPDREFLAAYREASELIERDWPLIERIADELATIEYLTYEEVEAMVLESDG